MYIDNYKRGKVEERDQQTVGLLRDFLSDARDQEFDHAEAGVRIEALAVPLDKLVVVSKNIERFVTAQRQQQEADASLLDLHNKLIEKKAAWTSELTKFESMCGPISLQAKIIPAPPALAKVYRAEMAWNSAEDALGRANERASGADVSKAVKAVVEACKAAGLEVVGGGTSLRVHPIVSLLMESDESEEEAA